MRKRTLGKTGLQVSELALGTWGLSGDAYGEVHEKDQDAVIDRARTLGITLYETADVYGDGAMERKLGERLPDDGETYIITKVGTDLAGDPQRKRFDAEFIRERLAESQERIGREQLDIVLLHNPSGDAVRSGEAASVLQEWADNGKLRAWGVSAGNTDVVYGALATEPHPMVVQLAYNVLFSQDLDELQYELEEHNVGLVARSVLSHGLLAGFWQEEKVFPPEDHRRDRWTGDQLKRRLHQLKAIRTLQSHDVPTQRGAAVRYVLENHRVHSAVLGPRSVVQLDQLVREAGKKPPYLDQHDKDQLESQLFELGVYR